MSALKRYEEKVLGGELLSKEEANDLLLAPVNDICSAADRIRKKFCGNSFDLCCILNGKSGKCGEDCKFCAQSSRYAGSSCEYPLMNTDEIVRAAEENAKDGIGRFSVVTSGRRLSGKEVDSLCESVRAVREKVGVSVCVSAGLLDRAAYVELREAGVSRAHCNLETSERYFPFVCTTHTYEDKIKTLKAAKEAGLEVCSGGIMGLGETWDDRISLAFALRELGIKSVPINFLNPIKGTPFEANRLLTDDDKRRTAALFRFILPGAFVRLAGGRGLIADKGKGCFTAGANATITGDMLTTSGISARTDMEMLGNLGYDVPVFKRRSER